MNELTKEQLEVVAKAHCIGVRLFSGGEVFSSYPNDLAAQLLRTMDERDAALRALEAIDLRSKEIPRRLGEDYSDVSAIAREISRIAVQAALAAKEPDHGDR